MLLRTFTGAAAPETEFARFKNDFVGMLRSGQQALTEQMGVLDRELHSMQTEIINAARPIPKIISWIKLYFTFCLIINV